MYRFILCTSFMMTTLAYGADVQLAENGDMRAIIVQAPQATRSAQLGARELQAHLEKIIGTAPDIVTEDNVPANLLPIHVGETDLTRELGLTSAGLQPQEQVIRISPQHIILIGHDNPDTGPVTYEKTGAWPGIDFRSPDFEVGTLYAVYDFLESECGVRWYMLGDLGTVVPGNSDLTVETSERRFQPWTTCRLIGRNSWSEPGTFGHPDSMGYVRNTNWANARDTMLYGLRSRVRGTDFSFYAHPFHNYHTVYGDEHPDWFVDSSPGPGVQLRFGKDEVVDEVVRNALEYFSGAEPKTPEDKIRLGGGEDNIWKLGPSDTRLFGQDAKPPIQPDRKRPDSFSDGRASNYWFTFVNRVAKRIGEQYPDVWIATPAYASHYEPPTFPLEPNVGVAVCNTEGWEEDSYGMENLRAWRPHVKRLFTYEYWYSRGKFPMLRAHHLAAYIGRLKDLGIEGWNMEMISGSNNGLYHLEYYLNMRLLYDPLAEVDALLTEYYKGFYGPAAQPMQHFWELMEATAKTHHADRAGRIEHWAKIADSNVLAAFDSHLAEAEKVAVAAPYSDRIAIIRNGVYKMLESRMNDAVIQANTPIPQLRVKAAKVAITVDGKLDETAWEQAPTSAPFVHMNTVEPNTIDVGKILWDGENLYVGMILMEPNMDTQTLIKNTSTSGICLDDSIEVFLDPGRREPNKRDFVQVMVTANGVAWRYYWGKHEVYAEDMPSLGIETAAWRGPDRWTVEIKIPLKTIAELTEGVDLPGPGDEWGLNLYRNRRSTFEANVKDRFAKGATGWSTTFGGFHVAKRFGGLRFE